MKISNPFKNITSRTEKWLKKANAYMYNFKDGHFQFPYAANDPELMVEGIKKTPFVNYDEKMQCLETDSKFMKIKFKYIKIEEGLWMTATHSHWKVNVKVVALADEVPSDYFFLGYSRSTDNIMVYASEERHLFENNSHSWTFYKSTTALDAYFKKDCKAFTTLFIFNRAWFEANIQPCKDIKKELVEQILDANYAYKSYIYENRTIINQKYIQLYEKINDKQISDIDLANLLTTVKSYITDFFTTYFGLQQQPMSDLSVKIYDRTRMEMVEKYLQTKLNKEFVGLETIADKFKISVSKLNTDFKIVYGVTVYQYFLKLQMELSIELLQKKYSISNISAILGYENPSKYSAKFKDVFGVIPSKYY